MLWCTNTNEDTHTQSYTSLAVNEEWQLMYCIAALASASITYKYKWLVWGYYAHHTCLLIERSFKATRLDIWRLLYCWHLYGFNILVLLTSVCFQHSCTADICMLSPYLYWRHLYTFNTLVLLTSVYFQHTCTVDICILSTHLYYCWHLYAFNIIIPGALLELASVPCDCKYVRMVKLFPVWLSWVCKGIRIRDTTWEVCRCERYTRLHELMHECKTKQ